MLAPDTVRTTRLGATAVPIRPSPPKREADKGLPALLQRVAFLQALNHWNTRGGREIGGRVPDESHYHEGTLTEDEFQGNGPKITFR